MKGREAVLAAMDGSVAERPPVAVFSGGAWSIATAGETFARLAGDAHRIAEVFAAGQRLSGSDMVFVGSGFNNYMVAAFGGRLLERSADPPSVHQPVVSAAADLARLCPAVVEADPVLQSLRSAWALVVDEVGDEAAATFNCWAPFTLAGQFCGLESLMSACLEEPEFAQVLVETCAHLIVAHIGPVLETARLEVVSLSDPTASGNLISRQVYERFALPAARTVVDFARCHGARTFLHVCGRTLDRIEALVATGAACLSLDTMVDLAEARRRVGPRVCLCGNVDPVGLLNEGTPEAVWATARAAMASAAGGPFVLGPGCDVPPGAPLANVRALVRAAKDWPPA